MNEFQIVRAMMLRMGENATAEAPVATALQEWTLNNLGWLNLGARENELKDWSALMVAIQRWRTPEAETPYVLQLADGLADILGLDERDHVLLALLIACDRLPRVSELADMATRKSVDLPIMLGVLSGAPSHEAIRFVRRSPILRLGLIGFQSNRWGETEVNVKWTLEKLLDRAPALGGGLVDALVGPRQSTALCAPDFRHIDDTEFLQNLVRGAVRKKANGINILIHGPPGTGKTEFARFVATSVGARLHAVGEADEEGDEPTRYDRVHALVLAQRVLEGNGDSVLLFDEMEDFIGDASPGAGDWMSRRDGSKVFINRLLETNAVPIIWTTNTIRNVDDAIIRRMSYVLHVDYPRRKTGIRIFERVAKDEGIEVSSAVNALIEKAPETTTILRTAARASKLANQDTSCDRAAQSLVKALCGHEPHMDSGHNVDMSLYNSDPPIASLFDQITSGKHLDVSILISGPPGTGKTALAHHFARKLDLPLMEKRASDLLSKWVGQTEANIANAFTAAREERSVLFFDEADSIMFDRSNANANWEVAQVNELLSWLGRHDLPVLAATNNAARLDPATLRRFDFKIRLQSLDHRGLRKAFLEFFEMEAPTSLPELTNLTPGDFAVVRRQMRHVENTDAKMIVETLERESALKPETGGRIGF